jgi:hypothetical protein
MSETKVVIRPEIVAVAATVEKRMQQVLDGKVNLRKEPNTEKFRRGAIAQTQAFVKLIERLEDQGDPNVDLQQIQNKMSDAVIMLMGALLILSYKLNRGH